VKCSQANSSETLASGTSAGIDEAVILKEICSSVVGTDYWNRVEIEDVVSADYSHRVEIEGDAQNHLTAMIGEASLQLRVIHEFFPTLVWFIELIECVAALQIFCFRLVPSNIRRNSSFKLHVASGFKDLRNKNKLHCAGGAVFHAASASCCKRTRYLEKSSLRS